MNLAIRIKANGLVEAEKQPAKKSVTRGQNFVTPVTSRNHPMCQVILKEQTVTEKAALPKCPGESWFALYHQLLLQRKPLIYDQIVGKNARYVDRNDKSRVIVAKANNCTNSVISNHVMKAGKHYAEFSSHEQSFLSGFRAGVMRPVAGWAGKKKQVNHFDPTFLKKAFSIEILEGRNEKWGGSNVNCYMYDYYEGLCCWSDWEQLGSSDNAQSYETWNGQEGMPDWSFRDFFGSGNISVLGLLLDLDEGTLTAYKNGRRLGIVKSGLAGEYCWVVSISSSNRAISIRRADIPVDTLGAP